MSGEQRHPRTASTSEAVCRLCGELAPIRESYVMPDFAVRWLRKTSVTGRVRQAIRSNRALRQIQRFKLLCERCEQALGRFENAFAEPVFRRVMMADHPVIGCDEDILRFVVALSWRALLASMDEGAVRPGAEMAAAEAAEATWRSFLLDQCRSPGEHHLLILEVVADEDLGDESLFAINWYLFRTADCKFVCGRGRRFMYAKLPGLAVLSAIHPEALGELSGTHLVPGQLIDLRRQRAGAELRRFIFTCAAESWQRLRQMSDRQRELTAERYLASPDRIPESYGVQVFLAQERHRRRWE